MRLTHRVFGPLEILEAIEGDNERKMFRAKNGTERQLLASPEFWIEDPNPLWEQLLPTSKAALIKKNRKKRETTEELIARIQEIAFTIGISIEIQRLSKKCELCSKKKKLFVQSGDTEMCVECWQEEFDLSEFVEAQEDSPSTESSNPLAVIDDSDPKWVNQGADD
jgi:hypothetical protein